MWGPGITGAQDIGFSERKLSVYSEKHSCISGNMGGLDVALSS